MKKGIFISGLSLIAIVLLSECNGPEKRGESAVNNTLVSDLAFRAFLRTAGTDSAACQLVDDFSDVVHGETNSAVASNANAMEGICCCPCDEMSSDTTATSYIPKSQLLTTSSLAPQDEPKDEGGNNCPCPTVYAWVLQARKQYNATIAIGDVQFEKVKNESPDWETFKLGDGVRLEDGNYMLKITGDFLGEGQSRSYELPVTLREGKPYLR